MSFMKDKLSDELKKQVEALEPAMKKLNFKRSPGDFNWAQFYHRNSGVRVTPVPIKEKGHYSSYEGFKLKVERPYRRHGRSTVLVKIDNLKVVRDTILDVILDKRSEAKSQRLNASFKDTLIRTMPRLFPGREVNVYEGRGDFRISVARKDHQGAWFDITISRSGQISKIEISYPGKELPDVAKFLETM